MAENKILNTRVQLKYDLYSEWQKVESTFKPFKGEVCIVNPGANLSDATTVPCLMKVGDGEKLFKDLPWVSALAADVYEWAKKPEEEFLAWVNTKIKKEIIDVTELPNPNTSAVAIGGGQTIPEEYFKIICVDALPTTGEVCINNDQYILYYNTSSNAAHGYVDSNLANSSNGQFTAGWYDANTLIQVAGGSYGGIVTSRSEATDPDMCYILVTLPTGEINESITYRVLNGTFVHNKMLQNHCICHTVEWENGPTEPSEPVLTYGDNGLVINAYYNVTNNIVYGYFDDITIQELGYYIDDLDLNELAKLALKAALKTMPKGWKTIDDILSTIGEYMDMPWGGVIASIDDVIDSGLYLLLSTREYIHRNNTWITTEKSVGMRGQFTGAEIFNDPSNEAYGLASHAEGRETQADGNVSHAEGYHTQANGEMSHAEGDTTHANGKASHSEGFGTQANGNYSHASGIGTIAVNEAQTVIGKYNATGSSSNKAFVIGNGSTSKQSNAMTVDWNGNIEASGTIKAGNKLVATEEYVNEKVNSVDLTNYATKAYVDGSRTIVGQKAGTALDPTATAEGLNNIASGMVAHAEGQTTEASGHYSHAEGYESKATGLVAHVEGFQNTAEGTASHAEGYKTLAGHYSHAEGENVQVTKGWSHGEGKDVVVSADVAHGEGLGTIAASNVQHVQGAFNIEDSEQKYLHIVGNGEEVMETIYSGGLAIGQKPVQKRSNAHTIDWDGNAWFAGEIKIGGINQEDTEAKTIATQESATVTMETGTLGSDETSIAKRYIFKQNGTEIGRIDLAKELVVTSGSVGTVTEADKPYAGAVVGDKYIDLAIANQEAHIYVPAKDLVDIYTAAAGATEVQIAISDTNEISASLVDNGVAEAKLSADVRTKLNKEWQPAGNYQPAGDYKTKQSVVNDPTASGSTLSFIDTISQNANGVISATKKNVNLSNYALKTELPTVNDGTFTVSGTGSLTGSGSMTANQASSTVANLDVANKGITTDKIADQAVGAEQTKAFQKTTPTKDNQGSEEVWVFYCGTSEILV